MTDGTPNTPMATIQDPSTTTTTQVGDDDPQVNWRDRFIRLSADFDNHRKRTRSEIEDARRRERDTVLNEWLEVVDSTERALDALAGESGPWIDGLEAIARQMKHALARFEVEPMDSTDAAFDPHRHEAIGAVPAPGIEPGTVLQTERTGYIYRDGRVLRAARVVVSRAMPSAGGSGH